MQGENELETPLGLRARARMVSFPGAKSAIILFTEGPLFPGLLLTPSLGQTSLITETLAVNPDVTSEIFFHKGQQVAPPTVTTDTGNGNLTASPQRTASFILTTALGDGWYNGNFIDKETEDCGGSATSPGHCF